MILQESSEQSTISQKTRPNTVLLVESDPGICEGVRQLFEEFHLNVTIANNGKEALAIASLSQPVLCIIGEKLHDTSTSLLVNRIKGIHTVPILVICSESEASVLMKECAGDLVDYISKPVDRKELVTKAKTLIKGRKAVSSRFIILGDLKIDESGRVTTFKDKHLDLTETEFKVLTLLATHHGKAISRDRLFAHAWGYEIGFNSNSLEVIVYRLRNKIKNAGGKGPMILTVRGFGYKLDL